MRRILASSIENDPDSKDIVARYARGCRGGRYSDMYELNSSEFINGFPSLLREDCQENDKDCEQCVWGSNEYDSYLATQFNRPVVSVTVNREKRDKDIDLLFSFGKRYGGIMSYYFGTNNINILTDQHYTIGISYTFPPETYEIFGDDMSDVIYNEWDEYIIYVYNRSHFNSVSII